MPLWFAEKFVSLLIEQHLWRTIVEIFCSCDLLKNSYLCLLNNTCWTKIVFKTFVVICWKIRIFAYWTTPQGRVVDGSGVVVICWKIRIFAYWTTPDKACHHTPKSCDLLKNSYLCLLNNTKKGDEDRAVTVVICWKIRIFAYWTTPPLRDTGVPEELWFAEKFVSLLIEQHQMSENVFSRICCDLLKNSYLCLLNNTSGKKVLI